MTDRLGCLAGFHMTLSSQHSNVSSALWWNTDSFYTSVRYLLSALEQHLLPQLLYIHFLPIYSLLFNCGTAGYIALILPILFSAVVFFFKEGVLFPQPWQDEIWSLLSHCSAFKHEGKKRESIVLQLIRKLYLENHLSYCFTAFSKKKTTSLRLWNQQQRL